MPPRKIKVVDLINEIEDIPQQIENNIKAIEKTDTIDEDKPAIENEVKANEHTDTIDEEKQRLKAIHKTLWDMNLKLMKTNPLILKLLRWLNVLIVKRK